jgi:hypothetical protein
MVFAKDALKPGRTYPLEMAKRDTFLPVFLKDLSPAYGRA